MVLQCLSTQVQFLVLNRSRKISLLPYSTQTTEIAYWLRADASPKKKKKRISLCLCEGRACFLDLTKPRHEHHDSEAVSRGRERAIDHLHLDTD